MEKVLQFCAFCGAPREDGAGPCPICGQRDWPENAPHQLPAGTLLAGRYRIGRCLGQGGFGITYFARDENLEMPVVVKEYFPYGAAQRHVSASLEVSVTAQEGAGDAYRRGLDRFLAEARVLARFAGDSAVVNVRDFFPANHTAYIVMEYLEGQSLQDLLKAQGPLTFAQALKLLDPVMAALERIHAAGLIHRDISPANLMLLRSGSVKLLDFGTARGVSMAGEKSLSVVLKPGYTPEEQYSSHGVQGPWTDVYALCATLYKLITGETPPNAMNRLFQDELQPPSALGAAITPEQELALLQGMAVQPGDRYQTMAQLRSALLRAGAAGATPAPEPPEREEADPERTIRGDAAAPPEAEPSGSENFDRFSSNELSYQENSPVLEPEEEPAPPEDGEDELLPPPPKKRRRWLLIAGAGLLAVIVIAAAYFQLTKNPYRSETGLSSVRGVTVTQDIMRTLARDRRTDAVSFSHCALTDEVLAELAGMDHVISVSIDQCTGYTDLSPLSEMASLISVDITGAGEAVDGETMFAGDWSGVGTLRLSQLVFDGGGLGFLANFPDLTTLSIQDCGGAGALQGFSALTRLHTLILTGTDLSGLDLSPIGDCTALQSLSADGCGITELTWMGAFTEMHTLSLLDNAITSLRGLENLTALRSLFAAGNQVSDLSPLSTCTALEELDLDGNAVADLSPLSTCTALTTLSVNDNALTDFTGAETLIYLEELQAQNNAITDLSSLSNTTQLHTLYLTGNAVSDLTPVEKNAGNFQKLRLADNVLTDLSPLGSNPELEMLAVENNAITSLDILSGCEKLRYLSAGNNLLTDISPLSTCTGLMYADLGDNQIADISPLGGITQAEQGLLLQNNRITDLSPLRTEVEYGGLILYGNPISDLSPLSDFTAIGTPDHIYLSWDDGWDFADILSAGYQYVVLVNVPLDRQAELAAQFEELYLYFGELRFCTAEEAEADMVQIRAEVRANLDTAAAAINLANYFNALNGGTP